MPDHENPEPGRQARRAQSALRDLLVRAAQTAHAAQACLVTPDRSPDCVIMGTSLEGPFVENRPYVPSETDIEVDVRQGDHVVARLVLIGAEAPVDVPRLEAFALAAGYILGHANELDEASSLLAETRVFHEMGAELGRSGDLQALLSSFVRNLRQLLSADYAAIAVQEADGSTRWLAMDGYHTDAYKTVVFPPGRGTAARAMEARRPLTFEAIGQSAEWDLSEFRIHLAEGGVSAMAVPLMRGGLALGALIVGSRHARHWKEHELRTGVVMANSAALAIGQARSAQAERSQRAFLSKIIENYPGYLLVLEPPDWKVALINGRTRATLAEPYRSGESPVGHRVQDVVREWSEQTDATLEMFRQVAETGRPVSFEQYRSETLERGVAWMDWAAVPVEDASQEGLPMVMLIAHDVTDSVTARQAAEQAASAALLRAEELEAVINQMADGVALYDAGGTIRKLNATGEALLGRSLQGDVEPDYYPQAFALHTTGGDTYEPEQLPYRRALAGEVVVGEQMTVKRPGGDEVVLSVSSAPIRDKDRQIVGAVSVFHDVTQEKMAERLKDEFLSVVSHELRTPLSAIMGYSDLMLRGVHGAFNERQARALNAVRANADRLLRLINDLLDVSRLEAGSIRVNLEPTDVGEVLGRTIAQTRVLAANAGVAIVNQVQPGQWPKVVADDPKLQQVLENLLANAVKFTPAGGTVTFQAALSSLEASDPALTGPPADASIVPRKARSLVVSVSDTGTGLENDQLTRIWDRFYQADSSIKRRAGGAGLGLSIVRNMIQLHGGQVWAHSEGHNRGSIFGFSLPLAPAEAPVPAETQPERAERTGTESDTLGTVLVAEDDRDQREIICDMLELEGYKVVLATDGEEALSMARKVRPRAIALDVILPRTDGWEVLHHLKADPDTRDIPVLIISVVDQQEFGKRLGADEYLIKPLEPMSLRLAVRRLTQLSEDRQHDSEALSGDGR